MATISNLPLSQSSEWLGSNTNYPSGYEYYIPTGATTNGTFTFTYNVANTYEIKVDVAPENPNNPVNDSYQITVSCPTKPAPTPSMTPTPSVTPGLPRQGFCYGNNFSYVWVMQETGTINQSINTCANGVLGASAGRSYQTGEFNNTTKTLLNFPNPYTSSYIGTYYGHMEIQVYDCSSSSNYYAGKYILDRFNVLRGKPTRIYPTLQIINLPTLNTYNGTGYWNGSQPYNRAKARYSTTNNICGMTSATNVFYSGPCFTEGVTVYTNEARTTLLTGYNYIETNGIVYNINNATGVVGTEVSTCNNTRY